MKQILLFFALLISTALDGQVITSGGKLKPEQAIMDIRHYDISLNVDFIKQSIDGYTIVKVIMARPTHRLLLDLLDSFQVSQVLVNNKMVLFDHTDNQIKINTHKEIAAGKVVIKVIYSGKPHIALDPPWADGFTWSKDANGHPWMGISCESMGGKLYFPCKDHPSDEPNEGIDMTITVPRNLVVAGPGLLKKVTNHKETTTFHWKTNYTINNYDIVFAVGDFAVVNRKYRSVNDRVIPLQFYVLREHLGKAAHHLDLFEKTIHQQEKYFGEYPWAKEKIGICETPFEGMEHQTMNAYGNQFNYTKVGGEDYDQIMHHEMGHEWWGNKISIKDWADYWIQEGICTYGDALYLLEFEGKTSYIDFFKNWAPRFKNKLPVVGGTNIDAVSAYKNSDIYFKGAFFMHTLCYIMGDRIFLPALKRFATSKTYTYNNMVTTKDLEVFFSNAAEKDLKPLFDLYLFSVNKLEVHIKQYSRDSYFIQLENISISLPMDITTDQGTKRIIIDRSGINISSKIMPVIDKDTYYLKKVTYE